MSKASQLWSWIFTSVFSLSLAIPSMGAPTGKLRTPQERWSDLEKAEVASFRRHVIPMFSRTGCNGRECHGAFSGQGGFQLSLFGYDFDKDHKEITNDQEEGVRIDRENIAQSLVLLKATNQEKHKGKERFPKGGWEYNMLLSWLKSGAKIDVEETGEFSHLEVTPKEIVFKETGHAVQLKVLAHWKDGTVEDVTQITRFRTNDESVSTISDTGEVKSVGPGDTHVVAFYDNGVLPVPVILPVSDKTGSRYPKIATRTKIDELVIGKLRKLGIVPSEVCTDTEFLRRASLDVTGTLPTPEEVKQFLADSSPNKRQAKIDELLGRPGYAAWWTTRLNDFTGNNAKNLRVNGDNAFANRFSAQWYDWIYERVAGNRPYDELAAGIILATSRTKQEQSYEEFAKEYSSYFKKEAPVDFTNRDTMPHYWARQNIRKPEEKALAFSHTFLGVRIECAQCHKHPFDQWTQQDFQQFQAFFEPIKYGAPVAKEDRAAQKEMQDSIRESAGVTGKGTGQDRRKLYAEFSQRVQAGQPAPWDELYVTVTPSRKLSGKQIAAIKKKDPNYSSRVLTPKILGGEEVVLNTFSDPRAPLMEWLRSKENPYFARSFVNRVWANYFGRGIVDPPDDMNLANPPVNEELMAYLADGFVAKGYDMKWLHREILNSDTYQRSWKTNPTNKLDEKNFSHSVMRRLPAEVVMDALLMASANSEQMPKFTTDMELRKIGPQANSYSQGRGGDYALKTFGKPVRETNCDCERTSDPTLLQTLYTRNDPELLSLLETKNNKKPAWIDELRRKYGGDKSTLEKLVAALKKAEETHAKMVKNAPRTPSAEDANGMKQFQKYQAKLKEVSRQKEELQAQISDKAPTADLSQDMGKIVEEVFLRTVSRMPSAQERELAYKDIKTAEDPLNGVRDLLWAMLNTREFMVNH